MGGKAYPFYLSSRGSSSSTPEAAGGTNAPETTSMQKECNGKT